MTLTSDIEGIRKTVLQLQQGRSTETIEELGSRLDALVDAVELLSQDRYEFPGTESRVRWALDRARRR
jgi:hypothetical protein